MKKESLTDKVQMQKNFIEELESRAAEDIKSKESNIMSLLDEENKFMHENIKIVEELDDLNIVLKSYTGATEKLRKLGNLKGKISNKVSTITKEHKFFTENTVCPTCDQAIEETFRINRINDAQTKSYKELQSGYKELEEAIKEKKSESVNSLLFRRRSQNSIMTFLKTMLGFLDVSDKSEIWNQVQNYRSTCKQKY